MTARKFLFAAALLLLAVPAAAEDHDPQAAQAAWAASAVPGEAHALLATRAGEWELVGRSWLEPGGEPVVSTAVSRGEMILGGRFLTETVEGTAMGTPFEGFGLTGYDNTSHVVTSIWIDTMGTVTSIMTGVYEKIGEPMELFGTMTDPASGMEMKMRTVTTFDGENAHTMDYYMSMGDMPEFKAMELTYKRK
jgi:hypothetical protein